jgi:hypothetical protein
MSFLRYILDRTTEARRTRSFGLAVDDAFDTIFKNGNVEVN